MKSYTTLRNLYGKRTKNSSTANLTLGDETINDEYRNLCALKDFAFLHKARTLTTGAATQFKNLPYDIDQVESVSVTISSRIYTPKLLHSKEEWDILNQIQSNSDFPQYAFVYNGQIGLYPTPVTAGNTITINGKIRVIDLNTADITSTTITTLANASTALTVSAGLTAQMVGFWIRPTFSTTANTGDGRWYEIDSISSATAGVLVRAYGGVSIAVGTAACTLAQMPILPENFHDLPVWGAAANYWYNNGDVRRGDSYTKKFETGQKTLITQYTSFITDPVLEEGLEGRDLINPNLTITI